MPANSMTMQSFDYFETPLSDLIVIGRRELADSRGHLSRFFCAAEFRSAGMEEPIAQINQTLTLQRGTVRGMHYQRAPYAETKVISCLRGEVFDVAVDLREGSKTFLKWHAVILSASNLVSLVVPKGFAHGFQTLSDDCELLYLHSAPYDRASEGAVNALDVAIGILWPVPITEMSERDRGHKRLSDDFVGL